MRPVLSFDVETCVDTDVDLRRFRWRLIAAGEGNLPSTQTFATKREAVRDGELALQRARARGRLRP